MNTKRELRRRYGRQTIRGRLVLLGATALAVVGGAVGASAQAPGAASRVTYGDPVALGGGTVRTYVTITDGVPVDVGVALSEDVFADLPADGAAGGIPMPDGHSMFEIELPMPAGNPTPFTYALVNWNPGGHEPPGIYDTPHFDVHFYTSDPHLRHTMNPEDPQFMARGDRRPDADLIPAGYEFFGPAVPFMGTHWIDPRSPELRAENPEPFTQTFIWGSWDGQVVFAEPMVTRAVLESREQVRLPVGVAARYEPAGYYPASYEIRWDEGAREHKVALTDLAWRD